MILASFKLWQNRYSFLLFASFIFYFSVLVFESRTVLWSSSSTYKSKLVVCLHPNIKWFLLKNKCDTLTRAVCRVRNFLSPKTTALCGNYCLSRNKTLEFIILSSRPLKSEDKSHLSYIGLRWVPSSILFWSEKNFIYYFRDDFA